MRINNNIAALNTHRSYTKNNQAVEKSTAKLSSGYKINSAADDAAGLAISEKMRAQIRGLNMAAKNSLDAISLIQTAEGALQETHNILQRMRELSVQSASDTNQDLVDRDALDKEYQALMNEIDDTARVTRFNNMTLIDGSFGTKTTIDDSGFQAGENGVKSVIITGFAADDTITFSDSGEVDAKGNKIILATNGAGEAVTIGAPTGNSMVRVAFSDGSGATIELDSSYTVDSLGTSASLTTLQFTITADEKVIQTGANEGDNLAISIDAMNAVALGISGSDVANRVNASKAIGLVDTAINTVSTQRAFLGALQNRMQHKINNLNISAENLAAAESRIRDVDMASEMTEFTKQNILVQASTSMLAQANSAPQNVLRLLQ